VNAIDSNDDGARLLEQVRQAIADRTPLRIRGAGSKDFLGRPVAGRDIDTRGHCGLVAYEPSELVVTVRAGTPLSTLNAALEDAAQMLPCEPPTFDDTATVGGMVAAGLAGPRRPWAGSVRDFVLGCRLISGHGTHVRLGGEVMKNVAGYDVSRLLAGSFGCLGLITEVSLKVLPRPRACRSVSLPMDPETAMRTLVRWRRDAMPVSAACYLDGVLHVRFEGGEGSVAQAVGQVRPAEALDAGFWALLRERRLPFFQDPRPLWRIAIPQASMQVRPAQVRPGPAWPGDVLLDWGGAQVWLKSDAPPALIRQLAGDAGGHAMCFTPTPGVEPLHPLPDDLMRFHQRLKHQMDPHGIFNPGRMYADL
jgi:glycolate oxidase FAD binding subunit